MSETSGSTERNTNKTAAATIESLQRDGVSDHEIAAEFLKVLAVGTDVDLADVAEELEVFDLDLSALAPVATRRTRDQGGSTVISLSPELLEEAGFDRSGNKVRQLAGDGTIALVLADRGGDRDE